jgi:hypothetical protein
LATIPSLRKHGYHGTKFSRASMPKKVPAFVRFKGRIWNVLDAPLAKHRSQRPFSILEWGWHREIERLLLNPFAA